MIYRTLHRKLKIEQHAPTNIQVLQKGSSSSTMGTRSVILVKRTVMKEERIGL
jgi:hypothetical protein